jgi:hypothetical protein
MTKATCTVFPKTALRWGCFSLFASGKSTKMVVLRKTWSHVEVHSVIRYCQKTMEKSKAAVHRRCAELLTLLQARVSASNAVGGERCSIHPAAQIRRPPTSGWTFKAAYFRKALRHRRWDSAWRASLSVGVEPRHLLQEDGYFTSRFKKFRTRQSGYVENSTNVWFDWI